MKSTKRNKSQRGHDNIRHVSRKRRKLSHAEEGDEPADSSKTASSDLQQRSHVHEPVVYHISRFLSCASSSGGGASSKSSRTSDGIDGISNDAREENADRRSERALNSVLFLVSRLERGTWDETTAEKLPDTSVSITKEDIAALLLPWSVARLMRSSSSSHAADHDKVTDAAWRTLSCCLDVLSPPSPSTHKQSRETTTTNHHSTYETVLSNSLPQSTLARLIPHAASIAFHVADDDDDANNDPHPRPPHASLCFHRLIRRYRPPLEIVCASLLRHIEQLVRRSHSTTETILPRHRHAIVCGTLRLLRSSSGRANPKRSFAALRSTEVLGRLGRLAAVRGENDDGGGGARSIVEGIVGEGLFHSVHHLEGFRSAEEMRGVPAWPTKDSDDDEKPSNEFEGEGRRKGCYQSGLFHSLRELIYGAENDDGAARGAADRVQDTAAALDMLPLLIRAFFDRIHHKESNDEHTNNGGGWRKTTTESDSILQFRFWCHAAAPAFQRFFAASRHGPDDNNLRVAFLKMTSETLKMILDYDAYSPSYSDPDGAHVSFLNFVAEGLLRCAYDGCDSASPSEEQKTMHLLSSIRTILLLNHRLLHERLSRCIAFACAGLRRHPDEEHVSADASLLLSTVVKTYGELRQVGYFLSSCRTAFRDRKSDSDSMLSLLSCSQATTLLASIYQSCPSGQIQEIWNFFDGWVVSTCEEVSLISNAIADETTREPEAATELIFAIRMFIVFIKNIRTDKHNSPELRNLCELSMTSSVGKLLSKSNELTGQTGANQWKGGNGLLTGQGIDLCGWLVDLHTRSCFWIDSITVDGNGSAFLMAQNTDDNTLTNVLSYLFDEAKKAVESEHFKKWKATWKQNKHFEQPPVSNHLDIPLSVRSSLLHLSMHRVHQLHSMIYYCNIQEEEDGDAAKGPCNFSSTELTSEAKCLVDFAIYIASSQTPQESIQSASLWLTVARSLDTWSNYAEPFHAKVFLNWFFRKLCESDGAVAPNHEKICVLTLVRDASSYEVEDCMSLLMQEGVMFALSKVLRIIEHSSPDDMTTKVREIVSCESASVAVACLELPSKIVGDSAIYSLNNSVEGTLKEVATVVAFLASAPLEFYLCKENVYLIDKFIGLDILISGICEIVKAPTESDCTTTLSKILCTTRYTLSSIIPRTLLISSQRFASLLTLVTDHLIRSSDLFDCYPDVSRATGCVLSELFSLCVDYHEKDSNFLLCFSQRINDVIVMDNSTASPSKFAARIFLIRSVIRRMSILSRRDSLSKKVASNNKLHRVCVDMTLLSLKHLWSQIIDRFTDREMGPHHSRAAATALLCASDILSFLGNVPTNTPNSSLISSNILDSAIEKSKQMFDLVSPIVDSTHGSDVTAAIQYFLSSVLTIENFLRRVVSPAAALETLLRKLETACFGKQEGAPLLEAALCSLIREAKLEDIKFVVSYVSMTDGAERHDPAFAVRIYHLLVNCVKSQEQIKFLSTMSTTVLSTSLSLLRQGQCAHSSQRMVSNTVLFSTIMSSLIPRKEILLLSGREIAMVCCEMSPMFCKSGRDANVLEEVTLFKSCCSVVSSVVVHYPKQLYGCPSPLFSLLLALMNDILQSNSGLSQKATEYAKICELLIPHKDIFKKHVLGLILRYIHALKSGMTPTTKSKLMPSVYGLIDMCSDFEIRQINAMIDTTSKVLFAPVFQSYRKYYQYHGQA
ncbi:hypothetical protein ACHAW6_007889 [Cyclotella cf. meneghiniana]